MGYKEEMKERRVGRLRTGMDIGMGIFYIAIGILLIYAKSFGNVDVPPFVAYLLGGMMTVGGGFRFYRGIKVVMPQKNDEK